MIALAVLAPFFMLSLFAGLLRTANLLEQHVLQDGADLEPAAPH